MVVTEENDVLRDEREACGHHLTQARVNVTLVRYNGTIHDVLLLTLIA